MASVNAFDGTTINYTDSGGDDQAIMLVHGITENSSFWVPVIDRLRPEHRVVTVDLRGHGQSGNADRYDLQAMAGDIVAVVQAASLNSPHIVGHSLGGAVVSAVGAVAPVASVVNVDQMLLLGEFKAMLEPVEFMLRDPDTFPAVMGALFEQLRGPKLSDEIFERLTNSRRTDQEVVLGVWDLIFSKSAEVVNSVVEGALAGYSDKAVPYLSLFGMDPGPDYPAWLGGIIAGAEIEVWDDHGHYPHLVAPDRFVARLKEFWANA